MDTEELGSVQVKISKGQIHRSVQNILKNEMALDPVAIRAQVIVDAEKVIQTQVLKYIDGQGYGEANLRDRVNRAVAHYESKIEGMVRDAIKSQVVTILDRDLKATIEMVVKNTEFKLGWGYNPTKAKLVLDTGTTGA